jgi:hypothetical protein
MREPTTSNKYLIDMLNDGFIVPDRIRKRHFKKVTAPRSWHRTPKYTTSLDKANSMLMHGRRADAQAKQARREERNRIRIHDGTCDEK